MLFSDNLILYINKITIDQSQKKRKKKEVQIILPNSKNKIRSRIICVKKTVQIVH